MDDYVVVMVVGNYFEWVVVRNCFDFEVVVVVRGDYHLMGRFRKLAWEGSGEEVPFALASAWALALVDDLDRVPESQSGLRHCT